MFGLCMPTGSVYLVYNDGRKENIECVDLSKPKKEMMESKHILDWVRHKGYENIQAIQYERHGKVVTISMAEYYFEHGKELED